MLVLELAALEPHCHDLFLALVTLGPFCSGWVGSTGEGTAARGIILLAFELFLVVVDLNAPRFNLDCNVGVTADALQSRS
jgi:hypothetical protein